jgi:hypothetical protein
VKIWDFSSCSTGVCLSDADEALSASSCGIATPTTAGNSISTGANQKPTHVLHTPNAVGRIAWRPTSANNSRPQRQQLQLATSSPDRGDISVWDVNMPNIPVCILKGHSNEACTGISWLDTPTGGPSSNSVIGPDKSKGVKGSFLLRSPPVQPQREERNWLGVHQHILSSGKDGRLLVQDLRNGTFPLQHIARAVATISSKGHVAYQRGEVSRVSPILYYVIQCYQFLPRSILFYSTLFHPILSYPILFHPILSYPILSYHILFYPILSHPILSHPIPSYSILSHPILSYPILSHPILSHPILSYPTLSHPIRSHSILSYPIPSYPILFNPIISYHIISCSILSHPILSYSILFSYLTIV